MPLAPGSRLGAIHPPSTAGPLNCAWLGAFFITAALERLDCSGDAHKIQGTDSRRKKPEQAKGLKVQCTEFSRRPQLCCPPSSPLPAPGRPGIRPFHAYTPCEAEGGGWVKRQPWSPRSLMWRRCQSVRVAQKQRPQEEEPAPRRAQHGCPPHAKRTAMSTQSAVKMKGKDFHTNGSATLSRGTARNSRLSASWGLGGGSVLTR